MKIVHIVYTFLMCISFFGCKNVPKATFDNIVEGYVTLGHEVQSFTFCGSEKTYWLKRPTSTDELKQLYDSLKVPLPYGPVFVKCSGKIDSISQRVGFAEDYDGYFELDELIRMEKLSSTNDCSGYLSAIVDTTMRKGDLSFRVVSQNGSISPTSLTITGLENGDMYFYNESDGTIQDAFIADLNKDGFYEVYMTFSSVGSGSYGSIWAFSSNRDKSASDIYLRPLTDEPGYMGHDKFYLENDQLIREYPIYKAEDKNSQPTGGIRKLTYTLKAGEASWILENISSQNL